MLFVGIVVESVSRLTAFTSLFISQAHSSSPHDVKLAAMASLPLEVQEGAIITFYLACNFFLLICP